MAAAGGIAVAGVLVGALAFGAVLDRRTTPPIGPVPTGTVVTPTPDQTPAAAPTGEIAFLRDDVVAKVAADGTEPVVVGAAPGASRLSWQAGGPFVLDRAFRTNSEAGGGGAIELMDGNGVRTRLWDAHDGPPRSPDISSDGRIAWATDSGAVFTMAIDGSDRRPAGVDGAFPTWSPDGADLAYITDSGDIAIVPALGGSAPIAIPSTGEVDAIDWGSNDLIVFSTELAGERFLFTVRADGSAQPRPLIDEPGSYASPTWSPDGGFVAFTDTVDGRTDLFVVPRSGGSPSRLTDDAAQELSPAWVPSS